MENVMGYINKNAPGGSYISLIADVPELYEKFGFKKCSVVAKHPCFAMGCCR
jgi:hypothetical protein